MTPSGRLKRVLFFTYLVGLHILLAYLLVIVVRSRIEQAIQIEPVVSPTVTSDRDPLITPEPTPCEVVETVPPPEPLPSLTPAASQNRTLIIPVAGINSSQLVDTFTNSRGESRTHDAIDIIAPAGTPVLAAVTGQIVRFFDSVPGGITIYQLSEDRRYIYYYAHLQSRSEKIKAGDLVTQGTTIGFVGDTGNAGPGNYHLHFSIARVTDPKRYWQGDYINPYPYLKAGKVPE